jgi:hypothetical protein
VQNGTQFITKQFIRLHSRVSQELIIQQKHNIGS